MSRILIIEDEEAIADLAVSIGIGSFMFISLSSSSVKPELSIISVFI